MFIILGVMATLILMVDMTNFVRYTRCTQKLFILGIIYQIVIHIMIIASIRSIEEILINGCVSLVNIYFIYVIINYREYQQIAL